VFSQYPSNGATVSYDTVERNSRSNSDSACALRVPYPACLIIYTKLCGECWLQTGGAAVGLATLLTCTLSTSVCASINMDGVRSWEYL
jgi:hypothetical protein